MKVENYFLRYAYPCAYIAFQRKQISQEELDELGEIALKNLPVERERLERVFYKAFEDINELADKRGKDKWDFSIIKEFFNSYHNKCINEGKGTYGIAPEVLKELSRVYVAMVVDKKENNLMVVYKDINGIEKKRAVLGEYIPDIKIGERVKIHYGYAVERE